VALTEKPADAPKTAAEQKAADDAAAKRRADDTRTADERANDRAAAAAEQLELQQLVAQRADALERDDDQAVKDIDATLGRTKR
jgi:hypothetical protein